MKHILIIFIGTQLLFGQNITWINNTPLIMSHSSPRSSDLNNDGIDDVVLGGGVDGFATPFGVIAIDGSNGTLMWNVETRNEMFTSPQFFDFSGDGIDDIIIGGRDAELRLIDGSNGSVIWEFWSNDDLNPNDYGWYNFYSSQIIDDLNGDGLPEILTSNGGDHSLDFSETNRPPGHIMIIDGESGETYKYAVVPDSNETYMSPIIMDLNNDGNKIILFGTGGESITGNLYAASLDELINQNLSNAQPLIPNSQLGYLAPPSIGDLNKDGVLDIVVQGFDGQVSAINGINYEVIWQYKIPDTESQASPILGKFTNSDSLDVFATIFSGTQSSYNDYFQVLIDGQSGESVWIDSIGQIDFCTPIAFDSNVDGKDEVLISVINNNGNYYESELILLDFTNNSQQSLIGPIPGGNISCTPQVTDLDNNGLLDFIFTLRADSINPFGNGGTNDYGLNTMLISTNYTLPEFEIGWGSYMGTNFNGQYNNGCEGDLGLFAFPSDVCPGENNGLINLYVNGGTPPFTYMWSNGENTEDIDSIGPGTYSVIVTDSEGVCDIISREVSQYESISFYESPNCIGGSDGMVYFNSTGCDCNTSYCQFIWELNGDTIAQGDGSTAEETFKYLFNISAGTYTATIIHPDGCQIQEQITIPESGIVDNYLINDECTSQINGSIELMISEMDSLLNFVWNTGDTTQNIFNLSEGEYSVIVSDTVCIDTLYFNILNFDNVNGQIFDAVDYFSLPPEDILPLNYDTLYLQNTNNDIALCSINTKYVYKCSTESGWCNNTNWTISGLEGQYNDESECVNGDWCSLVESGILSIDFINDGIYTITANNIDTPDNCIDEGQTMEVTILDDCQSINMEEVFHNITTYYNYISIKLNPGFQNYNFEFFDVTGKRIINLINQNNTIYASTENYEPGIYTIKISSTNHVFTKQIHLN